MQFCKIVWVSALIGACSLSQVSVAQTASHTGSWMLGGYVIKEPKAPVFSYMLNSSVLSQIKSKSKSPPTLYKPPYQPPSYIASSIYVDQPFPPLQIIQSAPIDTLDYLEISDSEYDWGSNYLGADDNYNDDYDDDFSSMTELEDSDLYQNTRLTRGDSVVNTNRVGGSIPYLKIEPYSTSELRAGNEFSMVACVAIDDQCINANEVRDGDSLRSATVTVERVNDFDKEYRPTVQSKSIMIGFDDYYRDIELQGNSRTVSFDVNLLPYDDYGYFYFQFQFNDMAQFIISINEVGTEPLKGVSEVISIVPDTIEIGEIRRYATNKEQEAAEKTQSKKKNTESVDEQSDLTPAISDDEIFVRAGEYFYVEILAWNYPSYFEGSQQLEGFMHEEPKEDITLLLQEVLTPYDGRYGELEVEDICLHSPESTSFCDKKGSSINKSWWAKVRYYETGRISLVAGPQDGEYWGRDDVYSAEKSVPGRFVPGKIIAYQHPQQPRFTAGCEGDLQQPGSGFTYVGQPIRLSAYALPTVILLPVSLPNADGQEIDLHNYQLDGMQLDMDALQPTIESSYAASGTQVVGANFSVELMDSYDLESSLSGYQDWWSPAMMAFRFDLSRPDSMKFAHPLSQQAEGLISPFGANLRLWYGLRELDGVPIYDKDNQLVSEWIDPTNATRGPLPDTFGPSQQFAGYIAPPAPARTCNDKGIGQCHSYAKHYFGDEQMGMEFLGGNRMVHGRLFLNQVARSSQLPLDMVMETQYYNGELFVTNTADNCTQYFDQPSVIESSLSDTIVSDVNQQMTLYNIYNQPSSYNQFTAGQLLIHVDKSAYGNKPPRKGYMMIKAPLTFRSDNEPQPYEVAGDWLQFPWAPEQLAPIARATLGLWEGDRPVIYRREAR